MGTIELNGIYQVNKCILRKPLVNILTSAKEVALRAGKEQCGIKGCDLRVRGDASLNGDSLTLGAKCDKGEPKCQTAVYTAFGKLARNPEVTKIIRK